MAYRGFSLPRSFRCVWLIGSLGLGMSASLSSGEPGAPATPSPKDPFAWLDEIESPPALKWAQQHNTHSLQRLQDDPRYARYHRIALDLAQNNTQEAGAMLGDLMEYDGWFYNLLQDAQHPRGLWRRTSLQSYQTTTPQWQPLLDIDALSKQDGKAWVFHQTWVECFGHRCLLKLSDGGKPNVNLREFDLESRTFVPGGFELSDAARGNHAIWKDADTVLVSTDFGPGSMSAIGTTIIVKEWKRGHPLSIAQEIFHGELSDTGLIFQAYTDETGHRTITLRISRPRVESGQLHWLMDPQGSLQPIQLPPQVLLCGLYRGQWIARLYFQDWVVNGQTWKAGSVLSIPAAEITHEQPTVRLLMEPAARQIPLYALVSQGGVLIGGMENVRGRLWRLTFDGKAWQREAVPLPDHGAVQVALSDPTSPLALVTYENLIHPPTVYTLDVPTHRLSPLKQTRATLDPDRYVTEQLEATSADGTRVPYFVARPKHFSYTGKAPTLLHGYGGLAAVEPPRHDEMRSRLWLQEGGVYVLANIRGGGELGPSWHVVKTERRRVYEDFIAVAEDLIRRRITSPRHLGIWGHSRGGLLVATVLNQRPDLFHAAIIQNPVLNLLDWETTVDGIKFTTHSSDFSSEYGSPDIPEERAFLERTSPYQNLSKQPHFPAPFLATTRTDMGLTSMTRKYAAKLDSLGMPFFYYEAAEGGHGMWITPEQHALWESLVYTYLARQLMKTPSFK